MAATIEVKVPDIGDYKGVPVIEVLVKDGDRVEKDAPLIVLESDKATMEVPAPAAGIVRNLRLKAGDKVSEGDLVCGLEATTAAPATPKTPEAPPAAKPAPAESKSVAPPTASKKIDVTVPDIGDYKNVP